MDQTEERAVTVDFAGKDGLDVWRHVHDLLPGPIAVMIAPLPDRYAPASVPDEVNDLNATRMGASPASSAMTTATSNSPCWSPTGPRTWTTTG